MMICMGTKPVLFLSMLAMFLSSFRVASGQIPTYVVIDLGALGGSNSDAYAINDRGDVVGEAETAAGDMRAFIWSNDVMTEIGTLGGADSRAQDINSHGHVCGQSYLNGTDIAPFYWADGIFTNLGTFGGSISSAFALNDRDQVTGTSLDPGATPANSNRAFIWTNGGALVQIPPLSGFNWSHGRDVNELGQVVGESHIFLAGEKTRPYVWQDANGNGLAETNEIELVTALVANAGVPRAINDLDQIVGGDDSPRVAFLHDLRIDSAVELGLLPGGTASEAWDINNSGDVVGKGSTNGTDLTSSIGAFIYSDGVFTNLNNLIPSDSGWVLKWARGINNSGQIVGMGVVSGVTRGFLLTPSTATVSFARHFINSDGGTGRATVVWRGLGQNPRFTLEQQGVASEDSWTPVEPAGQWPSTNVYYTFDISTSLDTNFFRVRGDFDGP